MEQNEMYSALISGVFTLCVSLISLRAGRKDAKLLSSKQIRAEQLDKVWEPLEILFSYDSDREPHETVAEIMQIIAKNHKLVPPLILAEVDRLQNIKDLQEENFISIRTMTSSFYNWTKKSLGYPYIKQKIKPLYTPNSSQTIFWHVLRDICALLIAGIAIVIMTVAMQAVIGGNQLPFPSWILDASIFIIFQIVLWVLLNAPHGK